MNNTLKTALEYLKKRVPGVVDYKSPEILSLARSMADEILSVEGVNLSEVLALEAEVSSGAIKSNYPNLLHLAIKLAKSKLILRDLNGYTVSLVMPAYGENTRILPRGNGEGMDVNGENFVVEKHLQLSWLFSGSGAKYFVYIIDDMSKQDPVSSGDAASAVIDSNKIPHFKVLFLKDGVDGVSTASELESASLKGVRFPKNTKKAGAVYWGAAKAIESNGESDNHVVVITDCDLSVDLGQIGNLIWPIIEKGAVCGAGSRRLPESILEISGSRNLRANVARYFRQLLLPGLLPKDTQCGAKAFASKSLAEVIRLDRVVLDFSFDIELLSLLAIKHGPSSIVPVAVAWFDSAELTTTDGSVHFGIMKAQLAIAMSNNLGGGLDYYPGLVALASGLTSSEDKWLQLLNALEIRPDLQERIQEVDPSAIQDIANLSV
jgi:hypothetical protein